MENQVFPEPRVGWQPSRRAQATRSLRLARRLRDEGQAEAYRAALAAHFEQFAPRRSAICAVR